MPVYNEIAHVPFFLWDPRSGRANDSHAALAQMHDVAVTLLDAFGVEKTPQMTGHSLLPVLANNHAIKDEAIFGYFGAHVSITDGRYVYMRASQSPENTPLYEYTLMPARMRRLFNDAELRHATLSPGFAFTRHVPVLKIPGSAGFYSSYAHGSLLFDLEQDEHQEHPLYDPVLEATFIRKLLAGAQRCRSPC